MWFDQQVDHNVLLLLDNFSAHEVAARHAIEHSLLRFTCIVFLLLNSTALYQLMDQGIINNLKVYYRKY